MAIDVTGATNTILPLNRQEPRATETQPSPPAPPRQEAPATPPDVEVDTALGQREAANRSLVNEASDLGVQRQDNQELADRLRTERDRVAAGDDPNLSDADRQTRQQERDQLSEDTFEALRRIRENALEEPFGNGIYDAGALPEDGFFVRNPTETLDNLDTAISALERQTELLDGRIGELRETFNAGQDERLSEGNTPIEDDREAVQVAARLEQQIREETPLDINGLSAQDRSVVLGALQT